MRPKQSCKRPPWPVPLGLGEAITSIPFFLFVLIGLLRGKCEVARATDASRTLRSATRRQSSTTAVEARIVLHFLTYTSRPLRVD
jgi:hypothetical protein